VHVRWHESADRERVLDDRDLPAGLGPGETEAHADRPDGAVGLMGAWKHGQWQRPAERRGLLERGRRACCPGHPASSSISCGIPMNTDVLSM
jgi:hypothetical protein